jgi:protein-S-isoprenylcysteine O-methyltransferase Ste14
VTPFKQLSSFILPITVLILVPLAIERHWEVAFDIFLIVGLLSAATGFILMIGCIAMFIRIGKGTLAPWSPTEKLVCRGVYAYTRNSMITGVLGVLLGESLVFHSIPIFIWLIVFFIINTAYFLFSEEPGLAKRFGREYLNYKQNVPRWIPRLTPWKPQGNRGRENNLSA